jgi:hypothetical protein
MAEIKKKAGDDVKALDESIKQKHIENQNSLAMKYIDESSKKIIEDLTSGKKTNKVDTKIVSFSLHNEKYKKWVTKPSDPDFLFEHDPERADDLAGVPLNIMLAYMDGTLETLINDTKCQGRRIKVNKNQLLSQALNRMTTFTKPGQPGIAVGSGGQSHPNPMGYLSGGRNSVLNNMRRGTKHGKKLGITGQISMVPSPTNIHDIRSHRRADAIALPPLPGGNPLTKSRSKMKFKRALEDLHAKELLRTIKVTSKIEYYISKKDQIQNPNILHMDHIQTIKIMCSRPEHITTCFYYPNKKKSLAFLAFKDVSNPNICVTLDKKGKKQIDPNNTHQPTIFFIFDEKTGLIILSGRSDSYTRFKNWYFNCQTRNIFCLETTKNANNIITEKNTLTISDWFNFRFSERKGQISLHFFNKKSNTFKSTSREYIIELPKLKEPSTANQKMVNHNDTTVLDIYLKQQQHKITEILAACNTEIIKIKREKYFESRRKQSEPEIRNTIYSVFRTSESLRLSQNGQNSRPSTRNSIYSRFSKMGHGRPSQKMIHVEHKIKVKPLTKTNQQLPLRKSVQKPLLDLKATTSQEKLNYELRGAMIRKQTWDSDYYLPLIRILHNESMENLSSDEVDQNEEDTFEI